ncbi:ACT domain-containing protein, partial [Pseudodonghicola flavimaris]
MSQITLTVSCPVRPGIVAAISTYLSEQDCNIHDSSQFSDLENDRFFMRLSFVSEGGRSRADLSESFTATAEAFGMDFAFHDPSEKMKVVIMVSRFGHCLNDLLYRWRIGALPIDIVAVISNHME